MIDKLTSFLCRLLFIISFALLFIAILDRILRIFGWTLSWITHTPGRYLEISVMIIIFAIALLLRQIKQGIKK